MTSHLSDVTGSAWDAAGYKMAPTAHQMLMERPARTPMQALFNQNSTANGHVHDNK